MKYTIRQHIINFYEWFLSTKHKINIYINHKWNTLYIRENEFHKSLDIDIDLMFNMNDEEQEKYLIDLVKRRNKAHRKDII